MQFVIMQNDIVINKDFTRDSHLVVINTVYYYSHQWI